MYVCAHIHTFWHKHTCFYKWLPITEEIRFIFIWERSIFYVVKSAKKKKNQLENLFIFLNQTNYKRVRTRIALRVCVCVLERQRERKKEKEQKKKKGKRLQISSGNFFLGSILQIAQYNLSKSFHLSIVFSFFFVLVYHPSFFFKRPQNK